MDISIYMQQAQHENIGAAKLHVYPEDKIYVALSALLFKTLRCVGCWAEVIVPPGCGFDEENQGAVK